MENWEVSVREQVRDTLARYNWAGDSGRVEDLANTFCEDGLLEIRGIARLHGRAEIIDYLGGVKSGVAGDPGVAKWVRHNVTNILFRSVTPDEAEVSCYFTVVTHIGLDHFGRYRDTMVPQDGAWLFKHRKVSNDWLASTSVMAEAGR